MKLQGFYLCLEKKILKNNPNFFFEYSLLIIGTPIFLSKTKLILFDVFFLSFAIKVKILFVSFGLKNLLTDDGKLELSI